MTSEIVPELDCILTVRDPGTFHISGFSSCSRNNLNFKELGNKLCRWAAEARSADTAQQDVTSLVVPATRTLADVHREGDEKEARKHTANNLVQAAKGIASIQVLRRAEQDDQIKALAELDQPAEL